MTRAEFIQRVLIQGLPLDQSIHRADILEMSGAAPWDDAVVIGPIDGMMSFTLAQRTVEAAVAMEREACAKLCEKYQAEDLAKMIRARG